MSLTTLFAVVLLPVLLALTGLVFVVLPFLRDAWSMVVCAGMLGIALGTIQPAILSSVHDVAPPHRTGEAMAVRSMTVHLSMATMPLVFGAVGAMTGAGILLWLMAVALGLGSWQAQKMRARV